MRLASMTATAGSVFSRIPQHFVGGNRATTFRFASSSFASGGGGGDSASYMFPRPKTVAWRKELSNTVHLIGNVGDPVEMKYTKEGKAVGCTKLGVKLSTKSNAIMWYQLNFLEELAGTAAEHLKAHDQVYVSGRLEIEKVGGEDNDLHTLYQVWVNTLNFIEPATTWTHASPENWVNTLNIIEPATTLTHASPKNKDFEVNDYASLRSKVSEINSNASLRNKVTEDNSSASLQSQKSEDQNMTFSFSGKKTATNTASIETLWRAYFDNPTKWWDNRKNKKNPRAPDFKHKDTGEALWIDSYSNPSWVKSKLDTLD